MIEANVPDTTTAFIPDDPRIGSVDIATWRAAPGPGNPGGNRGGSWVIVAGDMSDEPDVFIEIQAAEYPQDIAEFIVDAVRNEHARQAAEESK